jgi:hypothetical protein
VNTAICRVPNASQQSEHSTRISALAALTGGLAAYALLQPQAEALVAEPEPAGAETSGKVLHTAVSQPVLHHGGDECEML